MKMPDLEITIFNKKIKLSYQDNEKERFLQAVESLNKNWNKFSILHGKVSDNKIITLISLELQDSLLSLEKIKNDVSTFEKKNKLLRKEIEDKNNEIDLNKENFEKIKSELKIKNDEIYKTEKLLDNLYDELIEIKNNFLTKKNE
tara:strand:+ start:991 stop:1425 length:435 start_codon:yes stop_codon:yes gene_type:complete